MRKILTLVTTIANLTFIALFIAFHCIPVWPGSYDFELGFYMSIVAIIISAFAIALSILEIIFVKNPKIKFYIPRSIVTLLMAGFGLCGAIFYIWSANPEFVGICLTVFSGILIFINFVSIIFLPILSHKRKQEIAVEDGSAGMSKKERINHGDIIATLKGYKDLLDSGAITQEEFNKLKEKILK